MTPMGDSGIYKLPPSADRRGEATNRGAGCHRGAGGPLASVARPGRPAAARSRGRGRPGAGGPRRWLAAPSGHRSRRYPRFSGGHCCAGSLYRGPGRRTSQPRRRPVRHLGCGRGHLCPAQARNRIAAKGFRGRPAWTPSLETAAFDRNWLRNPRLSATRARRFRSRRALVGAAGRRRFRSRTTDGRCLHRRPSRKMPTRPRCVSSPSLLPGRRWQ